MRQFMTRTLLSFTLCLAGSIGVPGLAAAQNPVINEFVINHAGTDFQRVCRGAGRAEHGLFQSLDPSDRGRQRRP